MSTGNNKEETLVSKKRKRTLQGYVHPNKPEIKKFDFFNGGQPYTGSYHIHNSKEFLPMLNPESLDSDQVGCYTLVKMENPAQGTTSYQRIGQKYFLKYIKFKGHISININIPCTTRYKLLLIKSDYTYTDAANFFLNNYCNFEPYNELIADSYIAKENFCRHNFYKTYKWAVGMAEHRTSVMVVSSGTLAPSDYVPRPTKSSTLGSQNPSYTYTLPDILRFGAGTDVTINQLSYLPLNVSVQVNDNVEVGVTNFYLMLVTDHGIGVRWPNWSSAGSQLLYRASNLAEYTTARFNFFGCCYFSDL